MNLPSQDAIAEFQTLDSNYSPDYGIGSGGTIIMVLKSGTRKFHGERLRVQPQHRLQRQRLLHQAAGKPRSKFQLNNPGGNIGGPLFIPHVYNSAQQNILLLERRMAPTDPRQRAFDSEYDSGQQLPDGRAGPHYTPPRGKAPVVPATSRIPPNWHCIRLMD